MAHFNQRPGTKSAFRDLKKPLQDITTFEALVRSLIMDNPLGCTSWRTSKRNHLPIGKVREMYTAKFVYERPDGKRIGSGQEMYNSVEGYQYGIAAVISNMANIAAHRGKVRHLPEEDLFSVLVKCHDPGGELYFLSLSRKKVVLSSYTGEAILGKVSRWLDTLPSAA